MLLNLNEIRDRAVAFSKEWVDESSEDAKANSFWNGYLLDRLVICGGVNSVVDQMVIGES